MTPKDTVTIRDIAREAGVSPSTVSRVLNETTPVAPDKREAVLQAINKLKYRPNIMAQSLVWGQSTVIGVLTQDMASPFFGELHQSIEVGLNGTGYQPMFVSGQFDMRTQLEALDRLIRRKVDGIIILTSNIPDEYLLQLAQQIPLILVGRIVKGLENQCVLVNNIYGGYIATQHLLSLGHRRIVYITGVLNHVDSVDRQKGYSQALHEIGVEVDESLIVAGNFNRQSGLLAVEILLSRGTTFSAIFAANDEMGYGVYLGLFRRGLRIPSDVSLVGFDNQVHSAYTTPPLTTVSQPMAEMGHMAAQTILKLIKKEPFNIPLFMPQLILRESTTTYR